jgi:glycosyltransferase involved in cell wall biosynthesis
MPTLSLCMIVKDEEAHLPRCLASIAGVADELVVVDTGSQDRTVEIARGYGAKVVEWPWQDDFAAARNVSLDHATGDWIIYLDADEELVAEDREVLRELLSDQAHEGFYLQELSFAGTHPSFDQLANETCRLFRNRPGYRFTGRIHEQILPAILNSGGRVGRVPIHLRHYGYLDSDLEAKQKCERNLRIAQAEVERLPQSPFAWYNLGMEYIRRRDFAPALEANRKAFLHLPDLKVLYAPRLLRNLVASLIGLTRYDEALKVLADAGEAYPDYTDLLFQKGLIQLEQRDFPKAAETFRQCVAQGESASHYISDRGVGTYRAWFGLGYGREQMGDYRAAVEAYEQSLRACGRYPGPAHRLASLLLKVESPEIVFDRVGQIADTKDPSVLMALAVAFREARQFGKALELLEKALGLSPQSSLFTLKGEALLYLGRYGEATAALAEAFARGETSPSAASLAALASLLSGDGEGAERFFARAETEPKEAGRVKAFRGLSALLQGEPPPSPHGMDAEGRRKFAEGVWAVLALLLELQEFEKFEAALALLNLLGLSEEARHLQLGKLYFTCGFQESAIEELSQVPEDHVDAEAAEMLGHLCEAKGLVAEALLFFQAAMEREPDNPKRYMLFIGKALRHGRRELAREASLKGLQRFPNHGALREQTGLGA